MPEADFLTLTVLPGASPAFNPPRIGPVSKPDKGCLLFAGVCKAPVAVAGPFALHITSPQVQAQAWGGRQGSREPFADSG